MAPEATIATVMDVIVELLWINAVDSNPIKSAIKGSSAAPSRAASLSFDFTILTLL